MRLDGKGNGILNMFNKCYRRVDFASKVLEDFDRGCAGTAEEEESKKVTAEAAVIISLVWDEKKKDPVESSFLPLSVI